MGGPIVFEQKGCVSVIHDHGRDLCSSVIFLIQNVLTLTHLLTEIRYSSVNLRHHKFNKQAIVLNYRHPIPIHYAVNSIVHVSWLRPGMSKAYVKVITLTNCSCSVEVTYYSYNRNQSNDNKIWNIWYILHSNESACRLQINRYISLFHDMTLLLPFQQISFIVIRMRLEFL